MSPQIRTGLDPRGAAVRPGPERWTRWTPGSLYGPARRRLTPGMAGRSRAHHVALTFDDGPDPRSTPLFLDLLAEHDVRATFFLVGERARRHPGVVEQIVAAGHEIGVHGWTHRCVARLRPEDLHEQTLRTRAVLEDLGGAAVTWYRPPYGIATVGSTRAAAVAGLRPVLWTAWGRDWAAGATPHSIVRTVGRTLRPGGTVLLHDTDAFSAPGSWRHTLTATRALLTGWSERGWPVGPLHDHGLGPRDLVPPCAPAR